MRLASIALLCAALVAAQETDHRVGTYRVTDAFEWGYRSVFVAGDREIYRSAVNYNNGLRLFDGVLRVNSGDGHGKYIDELNLTTFGAGGDPYQATNLRIEKNLWFRFDMGFRINNYYNHLLALSGGEHRFNTERILQNYDLTLFPQRRVQLILGYDRNNENGPALTTENFDIRREQAFPRDQFFVFAHRIRRLNNQWRAGANTTLGPVKLSFMQSIDYYKEDPQNSPGAARLEPTTGLLASSFRRDDPVHGRTPFTRFNVHTDANRTFAVNGRFVYSGGDRRYVLDENISAINPLSGVAVNRQDFVLGLAQRTQGTGDLTLTYQPGQRWTLSNATAINQTRISGDSAFVELRTPASDLDSGRSQYFFDLLSIRLISNGTDISFHPWKTLGFYSGYHYSIRRVQSREITQDISGSPGEAPLNSFDNIQHSGLAGVRVRPVQTVTFLADFEYGRANSPFSPIGEKRFHAETVKAQWKHKTWLATAGFKAYRNRNDAPALLDFLLAGTPSSASQHSRQYSAELAWTPPNRVSLQGGYAKLHLDTASGIVNFPLPDAADVAARRSLYMSDLHHVHGTARFDITQRASLFLSYSVVKDTAGGQKAATYVAPFVPAYPSFAFDGTDLINAYPLTYHSPQARLTLKLRQRISWNAGWQYYGYHERFTGLENYHANIAYTSLRWGF